MCSMRLPALAQLARPAALVGVTIADVNETETLTQQGRLLPVLVEHS
jgi:hypothetical protein